MNSTFNKSYTNNSPSRAHQRRIYVKDEVPKNNIKVFKEKKVVPKQWSLKTMHLPEHLTNRYDPVDLGDYMTPNYAHIKRITIPTLIPNKEKTTYKLKLRLTVETQQGQKIAVIGSIPELGNWQSYVVFLKQDNENTWVTEKPIVTMATHFTYKYALIDEHDNIAHQEDGLRRIADLVLLPELTSQTNDFIQKQQKKLQSHEAVTSKEYIQARLPDVNNVKNMVQYDEWETFSIKFQVYEPFEDDKMDMRIQGNQPELDNRMMKRTKETINWLPNKYGKNVRPFEVVVKFQQRKLAENDSDEEQFDEELYPQANKFEYGYGMKMFGDEHVVYEREPHRVLHFQDPHLYRGELGFNKSENQQSHKVFVVNGKIIRPDSNFNGGFFFHSIKSTNIIIGTYPLTQNDIVRIQKAGATAILNIQTGTDMNERGVFWPQMVQKYNEVGIKSVMSYPISDKNERDYIEGLFDCAQHLNDLIEEQEHVVYLHCNSSISRSPTLVQTYLSLYLKNRTYSNLKESTRLLNQYHHMSTPNSRVVQKLLTQHRAFQNQQIEFMKVKQEEHLESENLTYLQNRENYGHEMTNEQVEDEQNYLFHQDYPPIAFNKSEEQQIDKEIIDILDGYCVTIPVVHVSGNRYLIGDSVETVELINESRAQSIVYVRFGERLDRLETYIQENHDQFEKNLIAHMFTGNLSIEEVCDDIINNRQIKTETVQLNSPLKLQHSQWVSINVQDKNDHQNVQKGYLNQAHKSPKRFSQAQPKIPESLKTEHKKQVVPVVPYQYKNKVQVISPLASKDHADPVYIQKRTKDVKLGKQKFLTNLTTNYYGENRKEPVRVYHVSQVPTGFGQSYTT